MEFLKDNYGAVYLKQWALPLKMKRMLLPARHRVSFERFPFGTVGVVPMAPSFPVVFSQHRGHFSLISGVGHKVSTCHLGSLEMTLGAVRDGRC